MNTTATLIVICLFIIGCSHYQISKKGISIPNKPGKYPKVTEENQLRGELTPYRTCYDVSFYDLDIELDIEEKSISGNCQIHARALTSFDTLQVDLFKNMEILSIQINNENSTFYRKHNAVFIETPRVEKGDNFEISIQYEGVPIKAKNPPWDGGFVWKKDQNGNPFIGVTCEGIGASSWWPNKDHPSDEPDSARLSITVPDTLIAVGNGQLESINNTDSTATFTWLAQNPINNYNITLNIGDYVIISDTLINSSGVQKLNHYVLSYNEETAQRYFPQVREVIHFFEKVFGEYPFWKDGYKLVETPYAGMEHQSAIAFGNKYTISGYNYMYDLVDYIILHETAHEWWGNSLTACDGADVWLHESFATYSEVLYVEEKLGVLVSIDYLKKKRPYISNKLPMVGPRDVNYWGFDDVYSKGAWVLHTLRSVINDDELFFKLIKESQREFQHSVVCTEEFIKFIDNETNMNLDYFFQQYLFDRKPPVFEYVQDDSTFHYKWSGVHDKFIMPLDIMINKDRIRLHPTAQYQSLSIKNHSLIEVLDKEFYIKKNLISGRFLP